jgi:diguanylate cyclase (GGDEF)-like protein
VVAPAGEPLSPPRPVASGWWRVSIGWPGLLLVGLCLVAAVQVWSTHEAMLEESRTRVQADAHWLAHLIETQALPQLDRDRLLAREVGQHGWRRLRLLDAEGRALWTSDSGSEARYGSAIRPAGADAADSTPVEAVGLAPARLLPADQGSGPANIVQVEVTHAGVTASPWSGRLKWMSMATAVLSFAALLGGALALRARVRATRWAAQQADGLLEGRFQSVAEPDLPEMRPLVSAMNLLVGRLQSLFAASSAQIEALRLQAHVDPVTGLSNRRHFMARLQQCLEPASATPSLGLLVLRIRDLKALDRRLGRESTDRVLQTVAQALQAYAKHVEGCAAGRLNGADFALMLPVGGLAQDTAQVLSRALRVSLVLIDPTAAVAIGAAEIDGPVALAQAMALADEALADAESGTPQAVATASLASHPQPIGEREWRDRLVQALADDQVSLRDLPVRTPDGRLLHLDCPLDVRTGPDSMPVSVQRWLAFARRGGLSTELDERALQLALAAIERDGMPRCIKLSAHTLADGEAVSRITHRLEARPEAARRLWIDVPEALALDHPRLVQEASRRWHPLGVSIGLEHAGDGLARINGLMTLGIDCVRVDARYVRGIGDAASGNAGRYLQGLVRLVQASGLIVAAEGVDNEEDLDRLWLLGFDAAAGSTLLNAETSTATA